VSGKSSASAAASHEPSKQMDADVECFDLEVLQYHTAAFNISPDIDIHLNVIA
jgi:hypothetical protein